MPEVNVNGVPIQYPATGDVEWGDEATEFAIQVAGALAKIGQSTPPATNNITIPSGNLTVTTGNTDLGGTLDVTGATSLDSTLTVAGTTTLNGTANLNGNTNIGNANTDTIAVTGILNVDTNTLYVNPTDNRVGINTATPTVALDVVGSAAISGTLTAGTFAPTDLTVDTNLIKTDSTQNFVGINKTTPTEALDVVGKVLVSSDITTGGLLIADDSTSTSAPPITFTGDTNTGIGRSGADTLDFITGGSPRFRIESTGQIKAVYESQVGTDYNTQLDNGYLCRAWVNFNGSQATGTYSRTGTLITCTVTSHGLSSGQAVSLDFTTGTATDGSYIVTVTGVNTFEVTDTVSGSTSGNVTVQIRVRGSGNVSSITDNGTGDYTINFTNAMPDANYAFCGATTYRGVVVTSNLNTASGGVAPATGSCRINTSTAASDFDSPLIMVAFFR